MATIFTTNQTTRTPTVLHRWTIQRHWRRNHGMPIGYGIPDNYTQKRQNNNIKREEEKTKKTTKPTRLGARSAAVSSPTWLNVFVPRPIIPTNLFSWSTTRPSNSSSSSSSSSFTSSSTSSSLIRPYFLVDDLVPLYHYHLYYLSRATVFDVHITDGPILSLLEFILSGDPHWGLTQTCSRRMDEAIHCLKEGICQIHRENFSTLVANVIRKFNDLVAQAKEIHSHGTIEKVQNKAKKLAVSKFQRIKQSKKQPRKRTHPTKNNYQTNQAQPSTHHSRRDPSQGHDQRIRTVDGEQVSRSRSHLCR